MINNIRIEKVSISNFKNIEFGEVSFSNLKSSFSKTSEILGMYGQNGSGKTAFIDAMLILKTIMSKQSLPKNIKEYVSLGAEKTRIAVTFSVQSSWGSLFFIDYNIEFGEALDYDGEKINLLYEGLYKKQIGLHKKPIKIIEVHYDSNKIYPKEMDSKIKALSKRKLYQAAIERHSLIFNSLEELLKPSLTDMQKQLLSENSVAGEHISNFENEIEDILLIRGISSFAAYFLYVVENKHSGIINGSMIIPIRYFYLDNNFNGSEGTINVSLSSPNYFDEDSMKVFSEILKSINYVINTIIPGLKIEIQVLGSELRKTEKEESKQVIIYELMSVRGAGRIPLKYESDGIKKIISLTSILITNFNVSSSCLIIDEFDSGVFEYLLGEILKAFKSRGKGQLIFTSHNLRPLEVLETEDIIFTTTNPKKKFIKMKNIKPNHNLRSTYYRSVVLGGQTEKLFDMGDIDNMAYALRKGWARNGI